MEFCVCVIKFVMVIWYNGYCYGMWLMNEFSVLFDWWVNIFILNDV